jgi:shikimate dehydrogenase
MLVGSMSEGAAGNPTVAMMEAGFAHHGIDARYVNMEVAAADLADAVRGARAMGFVGFNLSMPHKVSVIAHLDGLGSSAAAIGAVNCVVRRGDRLIGENTDGVGFLRSLREVRDPAGASVVLLGAGGAARAIAVELLAAGVTRLTVRNRSAERLRELGAALDPLAEGRVVCQVWDGELVVAPGTDVLVNGTSIGLFEPTTRVPVDVRTVTPGMVVADVVYNPVETRLLAEARAAGATPLDGLGMLVHQGAAAIELWTGVSPDVGVLRTALEAAMRSH